MTFCACCVRSRSFIVSKCFTNPTELFHWREFILLQRSVYDGNVVSTFVKEYQALNATDPSLLQEYRQLDLMGFSEKVARDVERITVSSSLGRQGPSASPQLPGATAGINGGLLTYQLAEGSNNSNNGHAGIDNRNGFEGHRWGSSGLNGRGGRGEGGAGKDGRPVVKPTRADILSKSWRGNPDNDIIGD